MFGPVSCGGLARQVLLELLLVDGAAVGLVRADPPRLQQIEQVLVHQLHAVPLGGLDVFIHPVAFAGWAGLLVTALNLIPAGTLDGGHVIYSLFGDKAKKAFPFIIGILAVLGFFWSGWWLWAVLLFWLGRVNAEPLDQITQLDPKRRALAALVIVVFILVFMPVPFMAIAQ